MRDPRPRVLIGEKAIARRVAQLAAQISRDYAGADELVLVGVLKGAFIFLADLARRLTIPRAVEYVALSSYGAGARRSGVRLLMDLRSPIAGKHVLVVEDIVDTGRTLATLMRAGEAVPAEEREVEGAGQEAQLEPAAGPGG